MSREVCPKDLHERSSKKRRLQSQMEGEKQNTNRETIKRKTDSQTTKRIDVQKKIKKRKAQKQTTSPSEDWSMITSENMAPSPKRIDIEITSPQPQPKNSKTEAMRKSTRKRHPRLAKALGGPVPTKSIEQNQFSIVAQQKIIQKQNSPSSFSFFIHKMRFKDNSPILLPVLSYSRQKSQVANEIKSA